MVNGKKKNQRRPRRRVTGLFRSLMRQSPLGPSPTRKIGDPIQQARLQKIPRTSLR